MMTVLDYFLKLASILSGPITAYFLIRYQESKQKKPPVIKGRYGADEITFTKAGGGMGVQGEITVINSHNVSLAVKIRPLTSPRGKEIPTADIKFLPDGHTAYQLRVPSGDLSTVKVEILFPSSTIPMSAVMTFWCSNGSFVSVPCNF